MRKRTLLQSLLLLTLAMLLPQGIQGQKTLANDYNWPKTDEGKTWFTYVSSDYSGENGAYGSMVADRYHVAIFIPTEMVSEGTGVEALRFWMAARTVSNMSIWASTYLPEDDHAPDICQTSFTYDDREQMERSGKMYDTYFYNIPFSGPVTVQGEGIYVGFSFTVDYISTRVVGGMEMDYGWDCYPLGYIENGVNPNSFYLRSTTRGGWSNWGETQGVQYLIGALISGSGRENALNVSGFGTVYHITGEAPQVPVTLSALGSAGATSIDYVITNPDESKTDPIHYDLPNPMAFGERADVLLPLPIETAVGRHPKTVTVTQVNGQPNESDHNIAEGKVITLAEKKLRKPAVEEFTATWSGRGPRGIVARERMKVNFPDQLVIIANHVNNSMMSDPMGLDYYFEQAIGADPVEFVPQTAINRIKVVDSYFGSTFGKNNAIRLDLNEAVKEITPAQLNLTPVWSEDGGTIYIYSDVTFLYSDNDAPYALAYVVTEDGMEGETEDWNQQNTYSGDTSLDTSDWLYPWISKRTSVSGVIYDDVAIAAMGIGNGLEGSLSKVIVEGEPQAHFITYDVDSNELVQDKSRLKVAVLLFNTETGEIVNAEQTRIFSAEELSGIENLTPATRTSSFIYDLQGRRMNGGMLRGIYIRDGKKFIK